ncbi:hypothetical protein DUI87_18623 [Hirundo rustica rustica]|uniref:Protein transport protein Sec61 subunit gamma n=1 Tax=Hirundo rustica rustica TaxID=333673 RepID=A0A3M0JZ50_HIRRU|nr:hypothetical protein DUI87_18623 [Hirundo rustica rustica]
MGNPGSNCSIHIPKSLMADVRKARIQWTVSSWSHRNTKYRMELVPNVIKVMLVLKEISEKAIMDQVMQFVEPSRQFVKDSIRLVKRCTKPDRKEFQKIAMATAIGFAIMGFIGFFVKLIHIPINNIIV